MKMRHQLAIIASASLITAGSVSLATLATSAVETPVVIMGAGDIAEGGTTSQLDATSTGDLIRAANPNAVLTLGDNAYATGTETEYTTKYAPTWGSFKAITHPAPGNHEYEMVPPAAGYTSYFGAANVTNSVDGGLYYARNVGNGWRAYALNSEVSMSATSAQATWLKNDLAANPGMHYLAYWHQPRYTSGSVHGPNTSAAPLWNILQASGADIVLSGHNHQMERFAKMNSTNTLDAKGIREFVTGSGGNQTYPFGAPQVGSEFRNAFDYGVIKLTLHSNSYDWAFVGSGRGFTTVSVTTVNKGVVLDAGTAATNNTVATPTQTPTPTPTPTPTVPAARPLHYVANEGGAYATTTALGYNIHDTGMSATEISALPSGTRALAFVGIGTSGCSATVTAAFQTFVTANASNAKLFGYYLTDEPIDATCVAAVKAYSDYIHTHAPGQKAFILLTDWPGTYGAYAPSKSGVDLIGLDPYPCQSGTCDYARIGQQLNAATAAGIPLAAVVPTFQAFGGLGWDAPTSAQLQTILNTWHSLVPTPLMEFTYSWSTQAGSLTAALSTRPDWQTVMAAHNGAATLAPVPTATPTTMPTLNSTAAKLLSCPVVASPTQGQQVICTFN